MEKHKCKVCLKNFTNGRSLGGHMRSHMMNLYIQKKQQISEETDSILLCSSSSEGEEAEEKEMLKKSLRIVDLQDRESETESSQNPTQCRRSKQIKKSRISYTHYMSNYDYDYRYVPYAKSSAYVSARVPSSEPVSSFSDTSPEEDVAYCLIMLSRDEWRKKEIEVIDYYEDDEQEEEKDQKQYKVTKTVTRGKYKCETCSKFFISYQALGGHVASHKKIKVSTNETSETVETKYKEVKIHECPVCYRVFSSGQALGGHKRSHSITSTKIILSRNEFSAASDAKFVNPIKPLKVKVL